MIILRTDSTCYFTIKNVGLPQFTAKVNGSDVSIATGSEKTVQLTVDTPTYLVMPSRLSDNVSHFVQFQFSPTSSLTPSVSISGGLPDGCWTHLFMDNSSVILDCSDLVIPSPVAHAYEYMFKNCTVTPPELPASTAPYCYYGMFGGSVLYSTPTLPATVLSPYCYAYMFFEAQLPGGKSPVLPAVKSIDGCYRYMFAYSNVRYYYVDLYDWVAKDIADFCYCSASPRYLITSSTYPIDFDGEVLDALPKQNTLYEYAVVWKALQPGKDIPASATVYFRDPTLQAYGSIPITPISSKLHSLYPMLSRGDFSYDQSKYPIDIQVNNTDRTVTFTVNDPFPLTYNVQWVDVPAGVSPRFQDDLGNSVTYPGETYLVNDYPLPSRGFVFGLPSTYYTTITLQDQTWTVKISDVPPQPEPVTFKVTWCDNVCGFRYHTTHVSVPPLTLSQDMVPFAPPMPWRLIKPKFPIQTYNRDCYIFIEYQYIP